MKSHRVTPGRRLESTLRRWHGELRRAGSTDERIHAARVVLKESRAVLRVFREGFGAADAAAWDQRLRQAMKALAPARDLVVMNATLAAHTPQLPRAEDQAALLAALARPPRAKPGALDRIRPLLDGFGRGLGPVVQACGWAPADTAFSKSRRRVRRLQIKAGRDDTPALWHRWRRRVKELAYQADFVRPPDLPEWKALRQHAWRLQAALGELQDLHVTLDHLEAIKAPARLKKAMRAILRGATDTAGRHAWTVRLKNKALRK